MRAGEALRQVKGEAADGPHMDTQGVGHRVWAEATKIRAQALGLLLLLPQGPQSRKLILVGMTGKTGKIIAGVTLGTMRPRRGKMIAGVILGTMRPRRGKMMAGVILGTMRPQRGKMSPKR